MKSIQKSLKRALASVLVLAMVLTMSGVPTTTVSAAGAKYAKSIKVSKSSVTVNAGAKTTVNATVKVANKASAKVSVKASKKNVVAVKVGKPSTKGVSKITITGKNAGNVTLTVSTKAKSKKGKVLSKKIKVTVKAKEVTPTPSVAPSVAPTTAPQAAKLVDGTVALDIRNAVSSDPAIATVDATGKVTAGTKAGTVTITGKDANGKDVAYTITVTSADVAAVSAVTSVSLDQATYSIEKGKSVQALATVLPADAPNKSVTFTSADSSIATVTEAGIIFGSKAGTTTITVTTVNGKTATATVTVSEPVTLALNQTSLVLGVNGTANLTANAAGAEWSSDNAAVATVDADGKVTAVAVGTANIIAKVGAVSASCKVQVTKHDPEKVGVTLSVFNPIKNNDETVIDNTVLINQDMVIQAYVEQNGAPLKGKRVTLEPTPIDQHNVSLYNFIIKVDGDAKSTAVTNENGIAEFTFSADNYYTIPSTYDDKNDCPYASFLLQTKVDNVPNAEDITVKFGSVYRSGIVVDNNRSAALDDIIPFDGHVAGDDGIQTTYNTNEYYADEWVTSQQVGNDVYLSATPQFILPPDRKDTEAKFEILFPSKQVTTGQTDVEVTGPGVTESYTLYNDGTDITTTTSVMNIPEGLVSMSVYFDKISISKYSQLFIDLYDYEGGVIGNNVFHWNKTEFDRTYEKEDGVQVENLDQMKGKGILIVSIQSPGQVDVSTTGYKLSRVTGDFNTNLTLLPEEIEVVNSVKWADVTVSARYEVAKDLTYAEAAALLPEYVGVENSYLIDDTNYTFAYRLPTFNSKAENANATIANALITATYTAPNGDVKVATYAYPTVSKAKTWDSANNKYIYYNVNELMNKTSDIKAIFLGYDVIDKDGNIQQTTGGIKQVGNQAIVSSTSNLKSGAIWVEARLTVNALEKEIATANKTFNYDLSPLRGADSKYPLYSYVQFVAKPEAAEADGVAPTFHAIEDQYVIITANVKASNGEVQTDQPIKFYYGSSKTEITDAMVGTTIGTGVKVASVDPKTNKDGNAYLVLIGNEGAHVEDILVEYKGSFQSLTTLAGDQEFKAIKKGNETVNMCNVHWVDLGLAYAKEVKDDHTSVWTYSYPSSTTEETASESVVSKTWKVGYLPIAECPCGDFATDFNTLRTALVPTNLFVGISDVGVDYQIGGDNTDGCTTAVDTTGDYKKLDVAIITSEKIGTTKVNGALRLEKDSVDIQYYDGDGELQTIKTVGVNEAKLNSKSFNKNIDLGGKISYTMTWKPSNWASDYIYPYGTKVAKDQATTVYFRLHDQNNNPVADTAVTVKAVDENNAAYTSFTASAKTNADGLVLINVPAPNAEKILTFTVAVGTEYEDSANPITYKDPGSASTPDFDGDPIVKKDTPQTVEIKFNNEVVTDGLTDDMLKKLFVVKDDYSNTLKIKSVELRFDRVLITIEDPTKGFIDNEYYTVRFASGDECKIDGVQYKLTDINGHAFADGTYTYFQTHVKTN